MRRLLEIRVIMRKPRLDRLIEIVNGSKTAEDKDQLIKRLNEMYISSKKGPQPDEKFMNLKGKFDRYER